MHIIRYVIFHSHSHRSKIMSLMPKCVSHFTVLCVAFKTIHPVSHHPSPLEVCLESVSIVDVLLVLLDEAPLDVPGLPGHLVPLPVHQVPAAPTPVKSPHWRMRSRSVSVFWLWLRLSQVCRRGWKTQPCQTHTSEFLSFPQNCLSNKFSPLSAMVNVWFYWLSSSWHWPDWGWPPEAVSSHAPSLYGDGEVASPLDKAHIRHQDQVYGGDGGTDLNNG